MTEEEAKTKWCPFARVAMEDARTETVVVSNRGMSNPGCIASECMAWRWEECRAEIHSGKYGYCGLAGEG